MTVSSTLHDDGVKFKEHTTMALKVRDALEGGAKTRDELVTLLGSPRTTVFDGLKLLIHNGEVIRETPNKGNRGRPKALFSLV